MILCDCWYYVHRDGQAGWHCGLSSTGILVSKRGAEIAVSASDRQLGACQWTPTDARAGRRDGRRRVMTNYRRRRRTIEPTRRRWTLVLDTTGVGRTRTQPPPTFNGSFVTRSCGTDQNIAGADHTGWTRHRSSRSLNAAARTKLTVTPCEFALYFMSRGQFLATAHCSLRSQSFNLPFCVHKYFQWLLSNGDHINEVDTDVATAIPYVCPSVCHQSRQ